MNLYWPFYLSLEKELLDISKTIHLDDAQLEVYSMRMADLLIRTVVEIEAISKELFTANGGAIPGDQQFPYFDTDCIHLLVDKWKIDKKIVLVSNSSLFFEKDENIALTPLHKAHKRGSSGADWAKAYQAVKHDRSNSLKKGTVKMFIRALAALYLLNIYYRDENISLEHDCTGGSHDFSLGSSMFSVKCHGKGSILQMDGSYPKNADFDECVYLSVPDKEKYQKVFQLVKDREDQALHLAIEKLEEEVNHVPDPIAYFKTHAKTRLDELRQQMLEKLMKDQALQIGKFMIDMNYDGVLNKNQY